MSPTPPRLATWILRQSLPLAEREFILGDLHEQFAMRAQRSRLRAMLWYWSQTMRTTPLFLFKRGSQTDASRRSSFHRLRTVLTDVRYALRGLRRSPGFSIFAIATLAVGIGANVAIFSVVDAVVLRRLPFPDADRLLRLYLLMPAPAPGAPRIDMFWSYPKYQTLREMQTVFDAVTAFQRVSYTLTDVELPERIPGETVGAEYFVMLGINPVVGRGFTMDDDDLAGGARVAVLGFDLWRRVFAADPQVIGRTVRLNGQAFDVVGIAPAGFAGLTGVAQVFVPNATVSSAHLQSPGGHSFNVLARGRPGVSPASAKLAVAALGDRIDEVYPDTRRSAAWGAHARTLEEVRVEPAIRTSVLLLFGAVGFVLLIACVNLANLLLSRAAARERETAVRLSIGASRGRIVQQLLTESSVLAVVGGLVGLALAAPGVAALRRVAPRASGAFAEDVSGLTQSAMGAIRLDGRALLFAFVVALITGLLFGLVPALKSSRPDLVHALKAGGGQARGGILATRPREALIMAEFALAFMLLVGSGLMIRSFAALRRTELGFNPDNVLTAGIGLPGAEYERDRGHQLLDRIGERIRALPGVEFVGFNLCTPLSNECNGTGITLRDQPADAGTRPGVEIHFIDSQYFAALAVPVLSGRGITDEDRRGTQPVVVVNETAARLFWRGESPIGKVVTVGQGDPGDREVVGVVGDVRYNAVDEEAYPAAYIPLEQSSRQGGYFVIRSTVDPLSLLSPVREIVRSLDPNIPLSDIRTMEARRGDATSAAQFSALIFSLYAGIALLLAAIGVYGVMSYAVARRTREIGIRIAIGAAQASIVKLVVGRAVAIALLGLAMGGAGAWALTRVFASLLHEVQPNDPTTFALVAIGLFALAVAGSYVPARRAARVNPLIAVRAE